MINTSALVLAALAPGAVAQAALYGYNAGHVLAPAVVARDNACSELPQLCTDLVMLHGMATALTYLCPEPTGPSTIHVTQTITTTVTVAPTAGSGDSYSTEAPNKDPIGSQEPTTTTTIKSTLTEHKTITVFHKNDGSRSSLPTPVITESFAEGDRSADPSATPPVVTWSLSDDIPPTQASSNVTSSVLAPTAIYENTTSHSGYARPTASLFRGAKASESMVPFKGMAEHHGVSSVRLLLGLMIAAVRL